MAAPAGNALDPENRLDEVLQVEDVASLLPRLLLQSLLQL